MSQEMAELHLWGYRAPVERIVLIIGALSFVLNAILAYGLIPHILRPALRVSLVITSVVAIGMCFLFFLTAMFAP